MRLGANLNITWEYVNSMINNGLWLLGYKEPFKRTEKAQVVRMEVISGTVKSWGRLLCYGSLFFMLTMGCTTTPHTEKERKDSFRPFEELRVGNHSLRESLLRPTGVVFNAVDFDPSHSAIDHETGHHHISFGAGTSLGTATAIDRRGYFLTAAHVLGKANPAIAFFVSGKVVLKPARIVWRRDSFRSGFDLALLHVDADLAHVFKWSADFEQGAFAVSAGVIKPTLGNKGEYLNISVQLVGGSIKRVRERKLDELSFQHILHNCPVIRGNSGGPLVAVDGKLIGINFASRSRWSIRWTPGHRYAHAVRPDLDLLNRMIDQDQASLETQPME